MRFTSDAGCPTCLRADDAGPDPKADKPIHDASYFEAIASGNFAVISCRVGTPPAHAEPATWMEAQSKLPACANPRKSPIFAARCGDYDAYVFTGTDSRLYYLYDATGQLVAYYDVGISAGCTVFSPTFTKPDRCDVVTPRKCSATADEDAGT
jgi:hypothetical protein